ncbi:MAG: hypothetical protein PVG01_06645 [Desulfobacterales bacterium]|jgi:hypothetical protein
MNLDFGMAGFCDVAEYDASDLSAAREKIEQYMSAGILSPKEIRNAERILRHLNKMTGSVPSKGAITETATV